MVTHSRILALKIPWTEYLDGLQSMGSQKVGYGLATKKKKKKNNSSYLYIYT